MNKYLFVLILLVSGLLFSGQLKAQSQVKWWLQSSLADSVKKELLWHASVKYSYTKMKGALTGVMNVGDMTLVERKGHFTHFSAYGINKMNLNLRGPVPIIFQSTSHYFTDYLDADLSRMVFCQAGFIWERDDLLLLQNRYSLYTGIGINVLLFKKLKWKSLVATGRIDQDYTIPVDNINVVKGPFAAFYCKHNFVFTIAPTVTFLGSLFYYTDIDAKDRYRLGSDLNLQVGIAKHINLVVGLNFKYDRELILFGVPMSNSAQNIGIEVSL